MDWASEQQIREENAKYEQGVYGAADRELRIADREIAELRAMLEVRSQDVAALKAKSAKLEKAGDALETLVLSFMKELVLFGQRQSLASAVQAWQEAKSEPRVVLEREGETVRFYPEIDEEEPDGSS